MHYPTDAARVFLTVALAWCTGLCAPSARAEAPAGVVGDWDITVVMGERQFESRLSVAEAADGSLAADWTSEWGEHVVSDVSFRDGTLSFKRHTTMNQGAFDSTFTGTLEEGRLNGTIHSEWGDAAATGTRALSPLVGTWELRSESSRGSRVRTLLVHPDLTGTYETRGSAVPLQDLQVAGDQVSFRVTRRYGDQDVESTFRGTLKDAALRGSMSTSRGEREVVGRKLGDGSEPAPDPIIALDALIEQVRTQGRPEPAAGEDAAMVVQRASEALAPDVLLAKLTQLAASLPDLATPAPTRPLKQTQALDHAILSAQVRAMARIPADQVPAHPAAQAFPGPVPDDAAPVTRTVVIDTSKPGWHNPGLYGNPDSPYWHSTGLYAAPGTVITVLMPAEAKDHGLYVRIGAHSDRLWGKPSWNRAPDICRRVALTGTETQAANAFGGLVYIEAPHTLDIGTMEMTVRGAVAAPHFVRGKTDPAAWRETIRNHPAPWGELETENVVLTLPSDVLRTVEDPESLMAFWDGIMDNYADLLGQPRQRRRAERFVSDTQISAGYMHSGYPLMTMLDITDTMVDRDRIAANGHHGVWGLFHEIGHNHQRREWTFSGTTEVTVNLFSLYVMEKTCGLIRAGHGSVAPEVRERLTRKYLAGGADFAQWKRDPFLALCSYIQLQEAFGWAPFTQVFTEYRELPDADRPRSDDDRRDQWLVRFSKAVGRDLGPFYAAWNLPTRDEARQQVADLPPWMPEDFPPE